MVLSKLNRRRNFSGGGNVVVNVDRRVSGRSSRATGSCFDGVVDIDSSDSSIETKDFPKKSVSKRKLICNDFKHPVKEKRVTRSETKARTDSGMLFVENGVRKNVSNTMVEFTNTRNKVNKKGKKKSKPSRKQISYESPSSINDLLSTGLLEGLPVVYIARKGGSELQGIIKEGGILCSCEECKGCRVILISQFELHACKIKRHATQYIFLENGKSLRQIMEICKRKSNDTLEYIIKNAVSSFSKNPMSLDGSSNVSVDTPLEKTKSDGYDISLGDFRERTDIFICYSRTRPSVVGCSHSKSEAKLQLSEQLLCDSTTKKPTIDNIEKKRKRGRPRKASTFEPPKSPTSERPKSPTSERPKSPTSKRPKSATSKWPKSPTSKTSKHPKTSTSKRSSNFLTIESLNSKNEWKITKKDNRLHKLVFEENVLPDGTELAYYTRGKKLLEGYKKGYGIFCCCCSSEVSPSVFESHAGCASRRKPYQFIYTSNGVSLHELAVSLLKGHRFDMKESDNVCIICSDGGDLLICDGCPRVFHKECASLKRIPIGDWYCHYCKNMFEKERFVAHNANAIAAGRMSGVDSIEQITKRSIRIVQNGAFEISACAVCRDGDFSNSRFGPRTVILCDQCQKGFHVGCLEEQKMHILKELPKGKWFCHINCESIYYIVQKLLATGSKKVPSDIVNAVRKKHREKELDTKNLEVRWQLLNGKMATPETKRLLAKAVSIFHDCFEPIVDYTTGKDLIPSMVYGRKTRAQEFVGMHCAILMVNSVVVSTGILRIFNSEIAELPLIATARDSQGKGYFQALLCYIQKMLVSVNVRNLVIPAAEETESKWTDKFGFHKMKADKLAVYERQSCQMTVFKGTSMLQKNLIQPGM